METYGNSLPYGWREVHGQNGLVGEKSMDQISHNTLTSCDHLLFMLSIAHFQCIYLYLLYFIGIYTFQDRNNESRAKKQVCTVKNQHDTPQGRNCKNTENEEFCCKFPLE